jgi:hypothetical protein
MNIGESSERNLLMQTRDVQRTVCTASAYVPAVPSVRTLRYPCRVACGRPRSPEQPELRRIRRGRARTRFSFQNPVRLQFASWTVFVNVIDQLY